MTFEEWKAYRTTEAYQKEQKQIADRKARASDFSAAQQHATDADNAQNGGNPVLFHSSTSRFTFHQNNVTGKIPLASNVDLSKTYPSITRLVVAIHSSGYDADIYLDNVLALLQSHPEMQARVGIVAPAFLLTTATRLRDIITWEVSPFRASSRAVKYGKKVQLSAYEVLDALLKQLIVSPSFPNLKHVVVLGHSAGGQMVNRYAVANQIENTTAEQHGVKMKYLVMAPSSYVYFDNRRAIGGTTNRFETPRLDASAYNHWGFGLQKLYSYHKRHNISAKSMKSEYPKRTVLYLVGENDNHADESMGTSKGSMLQGRNRLERAVTYYNHLKDYFGNHIARNQSFAIIKGVGHWGRGLILSEEGARFILYDR
jgi:hypothetical protein